MHMIGRCVLAAFLSVFCAGLAAAQPLDLESANELAVRAALRASADAELAVRATLAAQLSEYLATLAQQAVQALIPPLQTLPIAPPVVSPDPPPVLPPPPVVVVPPPVVPVELPGSPLTLVASPAALAAGQSAVLTLVTPTLDYHNVFINGVRPVPVPSGSGTVWTLAVTPAVTTLYQAVATNAGGVAYAMPSVTVTVTP